MATVYPDQKIPLPKTAPVVAEDVKSIDDAAALAAAKREKSKNEFNPDWLRLALAAGGGLISHSLASSLFDGKTEEEKRRQSIWTKLLSAIVPIGAAGLGAWGGYVLGDKMKKVGADASGSQVPMGTRVDIDGKPYAVSDHLVPTVVNLGKGWVPGMKSTELDFMNEKGKRDTANATRNEWIDYWSSLGLGGLGTLSLGYGAWQGGNKGLELLQERGAKKVLNNASRISQLTGDLKNQVERARKAEELLNSGKKGINITATEATKAEADALSARLRQEIAKFEKVVDPIKLQKAENVRAIAGKSRSGTKSLLGLGGAALAFGASAYAGSKERQAIEQQANIRAALEQLAAQTNAVPASVQSPVQ
jgi:hypothetical protein